MTKKNGFTTFQLAGPGGQQSLHQQLIQQQQLMQLAAAQAAGSGPGQQGPPGSGQINQMVIFFKPVFWN